MTKALNNRNGAENCKGAVFYQPESQLGFVCTADMVLQELLSIPLAARKANIFMKSYPKRLKRDPENNKKDIV